jgi:hypothetical protein
MSKTRLLDLFITSCDRHPAVGHVIPQKLPCCRIGIKINETCRYTSTDSDRSDNGAGKIAGVAGGKIPPI